MLQNGEPASFGSGETSEPIVHRPSDESQHAAWKSENKSAPHQCCVPLEFLQVNQLDGHLDVLGLAVCHQHLPQVC